MHKCPSGVLASRLNGPSQVGTISVVPVPSCQVDICDDRSIVCNHLSASWTWHPDHGKTGRHKWGAGRRV